MSDAWLSSEETWEALTDFIGDQRDGFHRTSNDMDSGELAEAVLDWIASHMPEDDA